MSAELTFVKYCPLCGAENPRQGAFCLECLDGDLSTVPVEARRKKAAVAPAKPAATEEPAAATPAAEPATMRVAPTPRCILELLDDPSKRFAVLDGQTVGRTKKADVILDDVPKLDWISGAHVRFYRRDERWYVQHIGNTNFIKVDGEMYQGPEEVAIFEGSILVLSLTPFRVNLGSK